jgi:hypothetical protein
MVVMERRKQWAKDASQRLHGRQRRHAEYHAPDPEPASIADLDTNRHATAQPSRPATPQELREQYVEHMIQPWARGVCLRVKSIRDVRRFDDYVDLLTAHAECTNHYAAERARMIALADAIFDPPETENAFTAVRQRLEALNAREPNSGRHSDEYVAAELRLYYLAGAWGLNLKGYELYQLVQEVEHCLEACAACLP